MISTALYYSLIVVWERDRGVASYLSLLLLLLIPTRSYILLVSCHLAAPAHSVLCLFHIIPWRGANQCWVSGADCQNWPMSLQRCRWNWNTCMFFLVIAVLSKSVDKSNEHQGYTGLLAKIIISVQIYSKGVWYVLSYIITAFAFWYLEPWCVTMLWLQNIAPTAVTLI